MSRGDTFHGAFHVDLEKEIERVIEELKNMGVQGPTKLEASALIAERSHNFIMSKQNILSFIKRQRGLF